MVLLSFVLLCFIIRSYGMFFRVDSLALGRWLPSFCEVSLRDMAKPIIINPHWNTQKTWTICIIHWMYYLSITKHIEPMRVSHKSLTVPSYSLHIIWLYPNIPTKTIKKIKTIQYAGRPTSQNTNHVLWNQSSNKLYCFDCQQKPLSWQ